MGKGSSGKTYEMDMCTGPILGKMLLFALPLMASSVLQLLFNAADVIVVGRFAGDHALAAVGSNTSLISLLTNLFLGVSVGVNVLVSRYYGAKEQEQISETVHTAIALSLVSGLAMMVITFGGARIFLEWMGSPPEVIGLAALYLRIYALGIPAMMVYNFGSAVLRAVGDTQRSLYYLVIAGIMNVLFNLLFVIAFGMGVAGVGLATTISQCVSAFLVIRCLMHEQYPLRLTLRSIRLHRAKLIRILQIGLPAGFQSTLFNLSNVMIQSAINSFGATVVAGSSASSSLEGFVYVAMNSFYQTTLTFTSQNIGAGAYKRINKVLLRGLGCVVVTGLVFGGGEVFFGRSLLLLYTSSSKVMEAGLIRLTIICLPYFLCGSMDVMVGSLRGMGYAIMPMIVSLIGACGLRLLWIFTFFRMKPFHTVESLYYTYPVTWLLTLSAHVVCFIIVRKKKAQVWGE